MLSISVYIFRNCEVLRYCSLVTVLCLICSVMFLATNNLPRQQGTIQPLNGSSKFFMSDFRI